MKCKKPGYPLLKIKNTLLKKMNLVFQIWICIFLIVPDLSAQTKPRLMIPSGNSGEIISAFFSPDGKLAVTERLPSSISVTQIESGKEILFLMGNNPVISADGKWLLIKNISGASSSVYNILSGKEQLVINGNESFFSKDGKWIIKPSELSEEENNWMVVFEIQTGKEVYRIRKNKRETPRITFSSPDGSVIMTVGFEIVYYDTIEHGAKGEEIHYASGAYNTIRVIDLLSGKKMNYFKTPAYNDARFVFSDGGSFFLMEYEDTTHIFQVGLNEELKRIMGFGYDFLGPDGKRMIQIKPDSGIGIYEVESGKKIKEIRNNGKNFVSRDKKFAVFDWDDSVLKFFDWFSDTEIEIRKSNKGWIHSVDFSPDGKLFLTTNSDSQIHIYEIKTGKEIQTISGKPIPLRKFSPAEEYKEIIFKAIFSPDGKSLIATRSWESNVCIYEVNNGQKNRILKGNPLAIESACFSPDARYMLIAGTDSALRIIELASGKEIRSIKNRSEGFASGIYSPDGKSILAAGSDRNLFVYETETGRELNIIRTPRRTNYPPAFHPDGDWVLVSGLIGGVHLYDIRTGKSLMVIKPDSCWILSAVLSPNGESILFTSEGYNKDRMYFGINSAEIFDLTSGMVSQILESTWWAEFVSAIYSPDGKFILASVKGNSILKRRNSMHIFDSESGKELRFFEDSSSAISQVVFSPDGKWLLTSNNSHSVKIFELATGKEIRSFDRPSEYILSASFSPDGKYILGICDGFKTILWDAHTGRQIYTRMQLQGNEWIVYDEHYRFDGTPGAMEKLYMVCGNEVIGEASSLRKLYVKGLAEKLFNGDDLRNNPKISDLQGCN